MKTCLSFILILLLLSQCNFPEPKNTVKERVPGAANLTPSPPVIKKPYNRNSNSFNQGQDREDKVNSFDSATKKEKTENQKY